MSKCIILSPQFGSSMQNGEFITKLNQPIDFTDKKGMVSLAEIMYHPKGWYNIRTGHNTFDLEVSAYLDFDKAAYDLWFTSWEYLDKSDGKKEVVKSRVSTIAEGYIVKDAPGISTKYVKNNPKAILRLYRFNRSRQATYDYHWLYYDVYDSEFNDFPNTQQYYFTNVDYKTWTYKGNINMYPHKINAFVGGNHRRSKQFKRNTRQTIPPGYYDEQQFAAVFNKELEKGIKIIYHWKPPGFFQYPINYDGEDEYKPIELVIKYVNNQFQCVIQVEDDYQKASNIRIKLHNSLAYQLGYIEYQFQEFPWISWAAGNVRKFDIYRKKLNCVICESKYRCDLSKNTLRKMCIFCDMCKPIIVNERRMQLLRILPIDMNSQLSYAVFMPEFREVIQKRIDTIRVWFTEEIFGEPIILTDNIFLKFVIHE